LQEQPRTKPHWSLRLAPPRQDQIPDELNGSPVFLSTLQAGTRDIRLALGAACVSLLFFLALVPFAKLPQPRVWAFIPTYEAALVVNDLITAVLLFGQFSILRTRALFVLACGYLFTASLAVTHALTFPGLFSAGGLLGAGTQTTVWLYMFWHGGFPLFIMAYCQLKRTPRLVAMRPEQAIALAAGAVLAITACLAALATAGQHWLANFGALLLLCWCKPHSVLDLWLMAVLCAWLCDIALAGIFNAARFDLGWYAGRIFGLLVASFVLIALLLENVMLSHRRPARRLAPGPPAVAHPRGRVEPPAGRNRRRAPG
jgi:hypothetical protein